MLHLPLQSRRAFTLLEVCLAVSLSVVLLGALYVALSMHYFQTRAGREIMDETIITRSVVNRIAQDIACELPPIDPRLAPGATSAVGSSSGGGSGKGGSSGSGGASGSPGSSAAGSGATASSASGYGASSGYGGNANTGNSSNNNSTSSNGTTTNQVIPNVQVYGDQNNLVLTGRFVPHDLTQAPQSQPTLTSDLRRVTYWVVPGKGLARHEVTQVTGADAMVTPPPLPPTIDNSEPAIIAHEVKSIVFEYYDGTNWQQTWDGTTTDPSGNTTRPIGPPAAVAFTVTLAIPMHGPQKTRDISYRHVVPIHTANNFLAAASTTGNNTSGNNTGSSNASGSQGSSTKSGP
jgi:hypothetical protein